MTTATDLRQLFDDLVRFETDLWNQVDTQLWSDMFTLPLYQKPTFLGYSSNYTGIDDNATLAGPFWNSQDFAKK